MTSPASIPAPITAVPEEGLPEPCPFCGVSLHQSGEMVIFWKHPVRSLEEARCPGTRVSIECYPDPDAEAMARWNTRALSRPSVSVDEVTIREICGDKVNGGLIRDMAYTVWHNCHNPSHEDGNSDWGNDNLPLVNVAVERVRAALASRQNKLGEQG